jgi:hypothetical protein
MAASLLLVPRAISECLFLVDRSVRGPDGVQWTHSVAPGLSPKRWREPVFFLTGFIVLLLLTAFSFFTNPAINRVNSFSGTSPIFRPVSKGLCAWGLLERPPLTGLRPDAPSHPITDKTPCEGGVLRADS